jgi:hypothetical protein
MGEMSMVYETSPSAQKKLPLGEVAVNQLEIGVLIVDVCESINSIKYVPLSSELQVDCFLNAPEV